MRDSLSLIYALNSWRIYKKIGADPDIRSKYEIMDNVTIDWMEQR